jgi:TonB family protein
MNRNLINLVAVGLWAGLLVGCVSTGSDSQSQGPSLTPATLSYPNMDSSSTNQPGKNSMLNQYDSALVAAVEKRWYDILKAMHYKPDKTAKVVMRFHLHSDGTVSDLEISENQADALLGDACERAIKACSPFDPWPPDMVRMIGQDYRDITFTFNY